MEIRYSLIKSIFAIASIFLVLGCTEPFNTSLEDFEDILVIDAFITSEIKQQEIFVSRTFITGNAVQQENDALVTVVDDTGNSYVFSETEPGTYVSDQMFGAQPNVSYSLKLTTSGGSVFSSGPISISADAELESITAERTVLENGQEGIAIMANGFDVENESVFYRYDYEETYRIDVPFSTGGKFVIVSENPPELDVVPKTREESVCYGTNLSNSILITTSENLSESRIENFQVRFIPKTDFVLRSRYSILVNQYVQSNAAQTFYEDLQEFSNITTLFAQTQPGFVRGNIVSENNASERVLGLFEVSSMTSKRIFINLEDFFPDDNQPEYIIDCASEQFPQNDSFLFELVKNGARQYAGEDFGVYFVVPTGCSDCNVYGTNVKPDFWID
ncbi:DUF4249 domain-containing protein [Flagellimonas sp. HMM57]|uniref:DUF4249 domain-containing protein n=1 Tax=unclassified Flagellimonas TaxID=2644544 RepID=UPI0013D86607|nr:MULTISPECIES: DUF4249 domain-containing protein [unclassified Flagellimonas]UII75799.1 DUF4249 domain-containing protein [Flagellimonas sp. HMM57]